ncbi:serine/threonine-protein kinase [Specibacter sp. NPDC057265]|uniref:serine/threonine-protein kinase n=1 Tax=Specibacter sp. NPDC057265 TaxID=3346075 RepID=UPI00363B745B
MSARRAPAAPPVLPGYRFVSVLGSGGFSDVYLYEQDRPRRKVAVKVLTADLRTEGARASFESEANLMAQLSAHPYIVTIFEAEITDAGHSYLAMEYCSRPSLDMQYRQGRFSVDRALEVGIQVASAVETAHRAGIAHRDIKPANILVTDYNRPALTDFGISGTMDAIQDEGGGMSIPWSPPESFGAGATDGVKVDVWSLGATIYSLLAGHSPFVIPGADNSQRELINRINSAPLPRLGRADVPEALELVLATAMAKSPNSRYGSAKDFARGLMRVQADLNLSVTPFEVQEEVAVAESRNDDHEEATRVRRIVSIDPDAATSNPGLTPNPGFPSHRGGTVPGSTGNTTGLNRNAQTLPSAGGAGAAADTGTAGAGTAGATGAAPSETLGGPTVRSRFSNVASPTQWSDAPAGSNPAHPGLAAAGGAPVLDSTVPRRDVAGAAQPTAPAAPAGRRGRWLGLGSALVLAAAVVVGVVLFTNGAGEKAPEVAETANTAPPTALIVGAEVPPVTELTATPKNGGAEWAWTNPDPQDGDRYLWASISAVDSGEFKPTSDARVFVVNGPNEQSCIAVKLLRQNGQVSEESKKCS